MRVVEAVNAEQPFPGAEIQRRGWLEPRELSGALQKFRLGDIDQLWVQWPVWCAIGLELWLRGNALAYGGAGHIDTPPGVG